MRIKHTADSAATARIPLFRLPDEYPSASRRFIRQRLLAHLPLLHALGVECSSDFAGSAAAFRVCVFSFLWFSILLLLLLTHHLRLHTLLARNDIARLVRVIHRIEWLCKCGKTEQRRRIRKRFMIFSFFEVSLKFTLNSP